MAVFLHFRVAGNRRALLRPSQIAGIITSGPDTEAIASAEQPLRLLVMGGETLDVLGCSARDFINRAAEAEEEYEKVKRSGMKYLVWDCTP